MKLFTSNPNKPEDSVTSENEQKNDQDYLDILPDHHRVYLKKKTGLFSFLSSPGIGEWIKSGASISLVALIATVLWNVRTANDATQQYNANLVKDYIESVKTLILDDYHHGKTAKYPEISVEEIEAFVRAKTGNTLKGLDKPKPQNWIQENITFPLGKALQDIFFSQRIEKQNLINFLTEAGIGFFPPRQMEIAFTNNYLQNVCSAKDISGYLPKSHPKDYTFHHFFCGINLQGVDLRNVELNRVILENANLQGATLIEAKLWQADLQEANLNNVDLSKANLNKANLKGVTMTGVILDNASLRQANLRGAWLSMLQVPDLQEKINGTSLKGADLVGANLQNTKLIGVDLSNAKMSFFPLQYKNTDPKTGKQYETTRKIYTNLRGSKLSLDPKDPDLKGTDLRGADLRGTDLSYANLRGVDLRYVKINQNTNLKGAIYDDKTQLPDRFDQRANMIKITQDFPLDKKVTNLSDVDLRNAKLTNAILTGIDLRRADLRGADLSNAKIDKDTQLEGALYDNNTKLSPELKARKGEMIKLKKVDLSKYQQVNCKESKKADSKDNDFNLREKDLSYLDLSKVDLSCTQLQGANLTSIDFDDKTKFTNAEYDDDTQLPFDRNTALSHDMRYAPHEDKSNLFVTWSGQNHQQADLRKAILTGAKFEGTIFTEARFQEANLTGANLTGADLTGANLWKADLTNANLTNANLTGANLMGASAKLEGANLTGANLTGANLTGVNLQELKNLDKATLCRATLPHDHELFERTKTDCPKSTSDN